MFPLHSLLCFWQPVYSLQVSLIDILRAIIEDLRDRLYLLELWEAFLL